MRAFLAALLALTMKAVSMAQAQSTEKLIFEKPPYLTAAKAISAGDTATLERLIAEGLDVNYEGRRTGAPLRRCRLKTARCCLSCALGTEPYSIGAATLGFPSSASE